MPRRRSKKFNPVDSSFDMPSGYKAPDLRVPRELPVSLWKPDESKTAEIRDPRDRRTLHVPQTRTLWAKEPKSGADLHQRSKFTPRSDLRATFVDTQGGGFRNVKRRQICISVSVALLCLMLIAVVVIVVLVSQKGIATESPVVSSIILTLAPSVVSTASKKTPVVPTVPTNRTVSTNATATTAKSTSRSTTTTPTTTTTTITTTPTNESQFLNDF